MSDKKKIYCFNNGGSSGLYNAVALAEDGACVAGHICSHEGYMQHDLGVVGTWKHELYDAHYGIGGWELEWIPSSVVPHHEGLRAAILLANTKGAEAT